jgi:hypothetical protein
MNLEERYYTESELRGNLVSQENDTIYSHEEVEEFSDLFDEFYSIHGDEYSDIDVAYDEFVTAYSNVKGDIPVIDKNPPRGSEESETKNKKAILTIKNPTVSGLLTTATTTAAGLGIAELSNRGLKNQKKEIEKKMTTGLASSKDIESLDRIKRKIRNRRLIGGGTGLALGAAASYAKSRRKK